MARPSDSRTPLPTPNETLVLQLIWRNGPMTVRGLTERMRPIRPLAYTTVLTIASVLCRKGWLVKTRAGRADIYKCVLTQEQARTMILRQVVDRFFDRSSAQLQACAHELDRSPVPQLPRQAALQRAVSHKTTTVAAPRKTQIAVDLL